MQTTTSTPAAQRRTTQRPTLSLSGRFSTGTLSEDVERLLHDLNDEPHPHTWSLVQALDDLLSVYRAETGTTSSKLELLKSYQLKLIRFKRLSDMSEAMRVDHNEMWTIFDGMRADLLEDTSGYPPVFNPTPFLIEHAHHMRLASPGARGAYAASDTTTTFARVLSDSAQGNGCAERHPQGDCRRDSSVCASAASGYPEAGR